MQKRDRRSGDDRRQRQDFVYFDWRKGVERRSGYDRREKQVDIEIDMRITI